MPLLSLCLHNLFLNIFILIINKNSTPCHILIMLIIGQFAPYIKALTNDVKNSIILIIGLLIILFFTLIFNEIIEIKCLELNKNKKKNIALRAEDDRFSVDKIDNVSEEDNSEIGEEDGEYKKINDSSQQVDSLIE